MLNTSQDVLWLAIALAVIVVSGFFSWVLYYIAQLLKQSNEMVQEVRKQIERVEGLINQIERVINAFQEKFASTGAALGVIAKGVQYFFQRKADAESSKNSSSDKGPSL